MTESNVSTQTLEKIDALVRKVQGTIGAPNTPVIDAEVQDELSKSIVILQKIKRCLIWTQAHKQLTRTAQLESIIIGLEAAN